MKSKKKKKKKEMEKLNGKLNLHDDSNQRPLKRYNLLRNIKGREYKQIQVQAFQLLLST